MASQYRNKHQEERTWGMGLGSLLSALAPSVPSAWGRAGTTPTSSDGQTDKGQQACTRAKMTFKIHGDWGAWWKGKPELLEQGYINPLKERSQLICYKALFSEITVLTMFIGKMRPDLPKGYAWAPSLPNSPSHTQPINFTWYIEYLCLAYPDYQKCLC